MLIWPQFDVKSSVTPNLLEAVQEASTSGVELRTLEAGKWSQKQNTNMAHLAVFQLFRDLFLIIFPFRGSLTYSTTMVLQAAPTSVLELQESEAVGRTGEGEH